ncbi:VWA domain-containing protein [Microcoleus sp. N3A4]|uniref:VWA domain-containing protein n=1 Tax=Microcoleus sp. N3A4 TaxID=3055379 RepID=UPI002FD78FC6
MAGVIFDPIEITKLLVFGESKPSSDNYNEHIRLESEEYKTAKTDDERNTIAAAYRERGDKRAPSIPYDMTAYMNSEDGGGGRFAYPSLFPVVEKFFNANNIKPGKYTYAQIRNDLGIPDSSTSSGVPYRAEDDPNINITISQYGTAINSRDHADRSYIFGQTSFLLKTENIIFEIKDGKKTINGMEVRAYNDNFDFESDNQLVGVPNWALDSLLNPYKLARIPVYIEFKGTGKTYPNGYSQENFATDQSREGDVALGRFGLVGGNISGGLAKLAQQGIEYIANLKTDPFLFYRRASDSFKVIYGSPKNDPNLSSLDPIVESKPYLIVGGAGNDQLRGRTFDDELDGGDGFDTAVYKGAKDEYDIQKLADGSQRISDKIPSRDGTDILKNIEKIVFEKGLAQDIAFVIDTTDSMSDDIDEVKARASEIINIVLGEKSDSPDSVSPDETNSNGSRIAVVGYNDPGTNIFLPFTDQPDIEQRKTAALNAINSISVGGGDDFPEVVNAGLIRALSGDAGEWRAEADVRRIILFGDAPPKDTELRAQVLALASNVGKSVSASSLPSSMSIAGDIKTSNIASNLAVTRFALQTDNQAKIPVEIFTILIGNDSRTAADFQSLATATGGKALNAADASEIVDVILEALGTSAENQTVSITTPTQNIINGSPSNDRLLGYRGNNILIGLEGNDTLYGGKDNDMVDGGVGDDQVWGDLGQDVLIGGPGNDTFFITGNSAVGLPEQADVITDFQPGDTIGLASGLLLNQLVFEPITLQLNGGLPTVSTAIRLNNNYLAIVQGVETSTLTPNVFIGV